MALVVTAYDSQYPDPLAMQLGDSLKMIRRRDDEWPGWVFCQTQDQKRGWVPESALKIEGDNAVAQQNYVARELSLMEGEIVRIEKVEGGWAWITNMTNQEGWVPLKNLKLVE